MMVSQRPCFMTTRLEIVGLASYQCCRSESYPGIAACKEWSADPSRPLYQWQQWKKRLGDHAGMRGGVIGKTQARVLCGSDVSAPTSLFCKQRAGVLCAREGSSWGMYKVILASTQGSWPQRSVMQLPGCVAAGVIRETRQTVSQYPVPQNLGGPSATAHVCCVFQKWILSDCKQ